MIRNLRSIIDDKRAVVVVVGIMVMLVLVAVTATAFHITLVQTSDSRLHSIPMVSMRQSGDHVIILAVWLNKVIVADTIIKVVDGKGNFVCNGILQATEPIITGGDTIEIPCALQGEVYTVSMIYMNHLVGDTKFIVY